MSTKGYTELHKFHNEAHSNVPKALPSGIVNDHINDCHNCFLLCVANNIVARDFNVNLCGNSVVKLGFLILLDL